MDAEHAPDPVPEVSGPSPAPPVGGEGLRFLVDGGRIADVDGFVELAVDGSLVGYSRSLLAVYGVGEEERESLARIGDGVAHQRALTAMIARRVAEPREAAGREPRAPSPSDTTFEDVPLVDGRVVERYGVPLRGIEGGVAGRQFVVRDVTEARIAQARLALDERMASIGRLAGGVAHELNNPLSGLFANLAFVTEQVAPLLPPGPEGREVESALGDTRSAAMRMRDVIRDLLTFARGEDGTLQAVDVNAMVESSLGMAWSEIHGRARVVRDLGDVPPVRAAGGRLAHVVLKLLSNAAQSIPEGAADRNEIQVSTRLAPDGRVLVEVADTGCGIAPEHLSRIFDPFFTTRPPGLGTGLGLPFCLGVVQALGGTIEVSSEVGRGSTFRLLVPASGRPPAGPAMSESDQGGRPVLDVDAS